jgi:hypothetical protein
MVRELFVICSRILRDLLANFSWFVRESFVISSRIFRDLFANRSWFLREFFVICSRSFRDLFANCFWTCSRIVRDLFANRSWFVHDLFANCSRIVREFLATCSTSQVCRLYLETRESFVTPETPKLDAKLEEWFQNTKNKSFSSKLKLPQTLHLQSTAVIPLHLCTIFQALLSSPVINFQPLHRRSAPPRLVHCYAKAPHLT